MAIAFRLAIILWLIAGPDCERSFANTLPNSREIVVVMHGLGRTSLSMLSLQWFLEEHGYLVDNWNYDGFRSTTDQLSRQLIERLDRIGMDPQISKIHFVTHSYGGIVVRYTLARFRPLKLGRFVQLAPPNQGAQLATVAVPFLSWILRPLVELQPGSTLFNSEIPVIERGEIAVIRGESDFVVREAESSLAEAKEIAVVDGSHTFIMNNETAQGLLLNFLRTGRFSNVPKPELSPVSP